MNTPSVRRVGSVLLLAALGLALAVVPQVSRMSPATAQTFTVCFAPVGSTAALAGTSGASISFAGCTPAPTAGGPAVSVCGIVTAYTAATASTTGSLTINGITVNIPVGYVPPSYFGVKANVLVFFTVSGNNLVDISPGNCPTPVPEAATAPAADQGGVRIGPKTFEE